MTNRRSRTVCVTKWLSLVPVFSIFASVTCVFFDARLAFAVAAKSAAAKLVLASSDFGRPFVAPPGLAGDRLKIFRDAYNRAMKDPGLLIEAKRSPLEINATTGQELEVLAKEVIARPKELVARMNKLMGK